MAQNVTIAGRQYSAVPAIDVPKTGGGTATFTDVTGTTRVATDVASGKYFFTASGVLTLGTASGGGGGLSDVVTQLPNGGDLHTITGIDFSNDTVDARHLAQNYTAHDSSGTAIVGTMSGGSANIQSLSVTQNGTYTRSGGVDGYSPVTVSVSGGGGMELVAITMNKTTTGGQYTLALYATSNSTTQLNGQYPPSTTTVYIPRYSSTQGLLSLTSKSGTYAPFVTGTAGTYTTIKSSNNAVTYRVDIGGTFTVGASDIS